MPKFLVLIYGDEQKWDESGPEVQEAMARYEQFGQQHADAVRAGEGLQPTSAAVSVRRSRDGAPLITDGPFVETKEALGGFYLLEAPDRAAALELALEIPAPFGGLEVRPVLEFG